jgi:hypothetical protein
MAEKPEKKDSYDYISGTASVLILSSVLLFGYQAYVWLKIFLCGALMSNW